MKISIIGAGAWGTAIAKCITEYSNNSHEVILYAFEQEVVNSIQTINENILYFKDFKLSENVIATNNVLDIVDSDLIFLTTPVKFIENTLKMLQFSKIKVPIIICSKGIEENGNLISDIIAKILPNVDIGVLTGPSFASEFANGMPGALVFALNNLKLAEELVHLLSLKTIRLYLSTDVRGVQLGGAVKNVLAIAGGICKGLGFGHNSLASLITRSLNELVVLVTALGGEKQTAFGLSGLGDLILTATSQESRNFSLGYAIGKNNGYNNNLVKAKQGIAEGFYSAKSVKFLSNKFNLDLPICNEMYSILYENKNPNKSLQDILNRNIKIEFGLC